jgi:prepilin-type N-terminal cleavage/methylation domain-containing protein
MRRESQSGFTLIELLIAITLSSMVMGAIGEAVMTGLRSTMVIGTSVADSHDTQMATAWFARDVNGASSVWGGPAVPAGIAPNCAPTAGAQQTVLTMLAGDATTPALISYVVANSGTELQVVRTVCRGPGAGTADAVVVIVHGLAAAAASASALCDGVNPCAAAASSPAVVSLSIVEASGFIFQVTGRSRVK